MQIIRCRKTFLIKPDKEDKNSEMVLKVFGNETKGGFFSIKTETIQDIVKGFLK